MNDWTEYKLGDVADFKTGKLNSNAAEANGKYPFFTCSPNIFRINTFAFNQKAILLAGNNAEGNFNIKYYNGKFNAYQRTYVISPKTQDLNILYLFYILKIRLQEFKQLSQGTSTRFITAKILSDFNVKIPPISIQDKIVNILSSLDNKIEVNRKINENLEQQAQALFKSWFVDFEPFQDGEFEESELGMIPKGWKVGELSELVTFKRGKTITSKDKVDGNIPVIAGGMEPAYYHNQSNTTAPVITISASGANAGYLKMYFEDVWASDCSYADIKQEYIYFAYCFLQNNKHILRYMQQGAVQPHVYAKDINALQISIPNDLKTITKFQDLIKPFFKRIGNNIKENQRLSALRDTLLPKLMSGEIEIKE